MEVRNARNSRNASKITETQGTEGTPTTAWECQRQPGTPATSEKLGVGLPGTAETPEITETQGTEGTPTSARTVTSKAETLGTTRMPATAGGHQHQVCQRQKRR
jgi:hypothetical protein